MLNLNSWEKRAAHIEEILTRDLRAKESQRRENAQQKITKAHTYIQQQENELKHLLTSLEDSTKKHHDYHTEATISFFSWAQVAAKEAHKLYQMLFNFYDRWLATQLITLRITGKRHKSLGAQDARALVTQMAQLLENRNSLRQRKQTIDKKRQELAQKDVPLHIAESNLAAASTTNNLNDATFAMLEATLSQQDATPCNLAS